jgi:uncharacterized protein YjlB
LEIENGWYKVWMEEIFESKFAYCQTFELFEDKNATISLTESDILLGRDKGKTYFDQYVKIS